MIQTDVDLQGLVAALQQQTGIPGLVAALSVDGRRQQAAAGLANAPDGIEMTADTMFLLGSVTKVWVTTLMLRLVEQGRLSLDDPVRKHLPEYHSGDVAATQALTVRHLLNHSSGLDAGDHIEDFGNGPDCIARYVHSLASVAQIHPVGAHFTYCNAGWVIAGRIVERVTGLSFDEALRTQLIEPLGLQRTVTSTEDAILRRVAVGHWAQPDGTHRRTALWSFPRALAPAGATLTLSAGDLLSFGEMHLRNGIGADGSRVLDAELVALMQRPTLPRPLPRDGSIGLGWLVDRRNDITAIGHTGGSPGGFSVLVLVPSENVALAAFCNSSAGAAVGALVEQVLAQLFGERAARPVESSQPETDLQRYAGVYTRTGVQTTVTVVGEGLLAQARFSPQLQRFLGGAESVQIPLASAGDGLFTVAGATGTPPVARFIGDGERPQFLFSGERLSRRAG